MVVCSDQLFGVERGGLLQPGDCHYVGSRLAHAPDTHGRLGGAARRQPQLHRATAGWDRPWQGAVATTTLSSSPSGPQHSNVLPLTGVCTAARLNLPGNTVVSLAQHHRTLRVPPPRVSRGRDVYAGCPPTHALCGAICCNASNCGGLPPSFGGWPSPPSPPHSRHRHRRTMLILCPPSVSPVPCLSLFSFARPSPFCTTPVPSVYPVQTPGATRTSTCRRTRTCTRTAVRKLPSPAVASPT